MNQKLELVKQNNNEHVMQQFYRKRFLHVVCTDVVFSLFCPRHWCLGVPGVCEAFPGNLHPASLWAFPGCWAAAWHLCSFRCWDWCLCAAESRHRLSPILYLQNGPSHRPDGCCRPPDACAWPAGPQGGRCLNHAQYNQWQPECSDNHDCWEGCWCDQGASPTSRPGRPCLPASQSGDAEMREPAGIKRRRMWRNLAEYMLGDILLYWGEGMWKSLNIRAKKKWPQDTPCHLTSFFFFKQSRPLLSNKFYIVLMIKYRRSEPFNYVFQTCI